MSEDIFMGPNRASSGPAIGEGATPGRAYPWPTLGWCPVRLSDAYSFEQLNDLRLAVQEDPANQRPAGAATIHLYTKSARKKLDALAWAVTHKLKEAREAAA